MEFSLPGRLDGSRRFVGFMGFGAISPLGSIQAPVCTVGGHQLRVRSLFDNATAVEDDDGVGEANSGEPVSDDEGGASAGKVAQRVDEGGFCMGVEGGCRLVEDQDGGVL